MPQCATAWRCRDMKVTPRALERAVDAAQNKSGSWRVLWVLRRPMLMSVVVVEEGFEVGGASTEIKTLPRQRTISHSSDAATASTMP